MTEWRQSKDALRAGGQGPDSAMQTSDPHGGAEKSALGQSASPQMPLYQVDLDNWIAL